MIVLGFIVGGLLLFALGLSGGCSRKVVYVPTESATLRVDTLREISARVDSVWVKDSVSLRTSGDTVFLERWRDRYKYVGRVDTVYKARVDSIRIREPFPVEVVKEVEKKLSWWQKSLIWLGGIMLTFLIALGGAYAFYIRQKKLR